MAKTVVKLFRDPEQAEKAAAELKAAGFKAEEIGVLTADRGTAEKLAAGNMDIAADLSLPEAGPVYATGPLATALKEASAAEGDSLEAALAASLDISEEAIKYYEFGIAVGGILLGVRADEGRSSKAQEILRSADTEAADLGPMWSKSPGFAAASRMTQTNPIDAPMSGDFRRY